MSRTNTAPSPEPSPISHEDLMAKVSQLKREGDELLYEMFCRGKLLSRGKDTSHYDGLMMVEGFGVLVFIFVYFNAKMFRDIEWSIQGTTGWKPDPSSFFQSLKWYRACAL